MAKVGRKPVKKREKIKPIVVGVDSMQKNKLKRIAKRRKISVSLLVRGLIDGL